MSKQEDKSGEKQVNAISPDNYNYNTKITFKGYFILFGTDLLQEVEGPFHASRKTYLEVGAFALIEGGLFFADKPVQKFSQDFMHNNPNLAKVSSNVTSFGGLYEAYLIAGLGIYSFALHKEKVKTTTLLVTQAYLVGAAMEGVLKFVSGRERPNYYDPNNPTTQYPGTFRGPFANLGRDANGTKLNSSFPSGHTTVAFAAATVFAMEYKHSIVIPIIAYSAATLVGLSRITENKHWATDVFAGAALGYVTGRQVVDNYHRYAKLHGGDKTKGKLLPTMGFNFGHLCPGLVYAFN